MTPTDKLSELLAAAERMARELAIIIHDWDGEQEDMIDAKDALDEYNGTANAAFRAIRGGGNG